MLLSIRDLNIQAGLKTLVDRVSFDIPQGKIVALVGGSGSGKTTIGLSVLQLLSPGLKLTQGQIMFTGKDLLSLSQEAMRQCRGAQIGFVFQEPLYAFDSLFTIGAQIEEVLEVHTQLTRSQRREKTLETLALVELPDPQRSYHSYPHQLSGGMRQRAMIAQAIVCSPSLIIADEPTSNLDVTLQAKMMELFRKLRREKQMSVLLIAHDLGMVSHLADEVVVLNKGKVVEAGGVRQMIDHPKHEYTKQLLEAF